MSSSAELRRSVEGCRLYHPIYDDHYQWLKQRIDDAIQGFRPRNEGIIGPSRAGKSMVLEALALDYPPTRINGVREVPVLKVKLPPAISPKLFPVHILKALNVPVPSKGNSSGVLLARVCEQLRLAKTKVMLLDEASHFVEPSARVPPRAAGDMLKTLSDGAELSIVAAGIPRLERLFEANEQLRLRTSVRRVFNPYDFSNPDHRRHFIQCVKTYADLFEKHGWPIAIELPVLVKQCYLQCGGLIGVLSAFMRELAIRKRGEAPRALTLEDCKEAASRTEGTGHPLHKPFASEQVSDVELHQAYGHVLETYDMPSLRKY